MTRRTAVACALLGALAVICAGRADAEPRLEPPKAIETPTPLAPAGTTVAPVFILDVLITTAGAVTSAKVVEGEPSLASLVETAVLAWKFEPALRDGTPVAAKIHVRVELRLAASTAVTPEPPAATRPDTSKGGVTPAPQPTPPASGDVDDVTVRGTRPLAPHVQILAAEIREMPGAFGDAFRAIEALPGVTPILSGIPYFVIRGAPPGNTGYLIDGIRVPGLFHFAIGQAVIHPALVESVDLYSGTYPARFGRFAGGILSGDTVPPGDKLRGEANVRLLDTGALLEVPFASGKGDAVVAGRIGYPGLLLYVFDPNVGLQYYDYQARVSYRFNDGSEFRVFGFGSYDSLAAREDSGGPLQELLAVEFERLSARYTRKVARNAELRLEATVGHDKTAVGTSPPLTLSSESYSVKGELVTHPGEDTTVRVGGDLVFEPYHFDFTAFTNASSDPFGGALLGALLPTNQNDLDAGVYGELATKLSRRIDAEVGLRADLFTASYPGQPSTDPGTRARQVPALDPRLTVRYKVTPALSWISALGIAHQASNIPLPVPALSFSQLGRGLQTAYQMSEGVEVKLPFRFTGTATGFLNNFTGLAQVTNGCASDAPTSCASTTVHGRSYGLELMVRRNLTERLSGWLSYTLSRSERDSFNGFNDTWGHRLSEFDRPQVANLVVAYDLGAHWRAGGRFVAYSGTPYATASLDGTPNARTPPFFRLDLRVEKKWLKTWGHVSFIIEWLNVLVQKEPLGLTCSVAGNTTCTPTLVGPITIPSLGVEAGF